MKAVLIGENRSLHWSEVPDPVMGAEDCLVKIEYAALNRADLMQREGNYPPPPGAPEWMGLEIAGHILAVGEEAAKHSSWKVGDAVCALLGGGGYAQLVNVRYDMLMPVPRGCSLAEAAAMPEAFATSYLNLFMEGHIQAGNTLLMHAGASGLASVVIPMAHAFGVRTITSVRTRGEAERLTHLPVDRIVVTQEEDMAQALKQELDAGHPVDVAIDCLGGEMMGRCLPYLSRGARWIMIATLAGDMTQVDLRNVYVRNVRIIGSTLRSRAPQVKAQILADLVKQVWPKVEAGEIRPTIYKILPITQAEEAQDILYRGESVGKVVLQVEEA